MTHARTTSDPILVAVIGNALDGITREIGQTMLRTSRSPIFVEARDFATSIFSADCRLLAQTHYIPVIGGATPYAQRAIVDFFGDDVHDGDVFIHNDPFNGGSHLPDITITRPIFWDGELVFWAMTKGHNADVGGGGVVGFNPAARDVLDEGIRIPPVRIIDRGTLRKDAWELILTNVRMRSLVESVLNCQIGATAIGERRLHALLDKYGAATLSDATDELMRASARQVRAQIAQIPDGEYSAESLVDNDGIDRSRPYRIALTIKFTARSSLSISAPATRRPKDSSTARSPTLSPRPTSPCSDPSIRTSATTARHRSDRGRRPCGSIVNPSDPAPVAACTVPTCEAIAGAVWVALSQAIPSLAHAGWARWCTPATMGVNPRTGRPFGDCISLARAVAAPPKGSTAGTTCRPRTPWEDCAPRTPNFMNWTPRTCWRSSSTFRTARAVASGVADWACVTGGGYRPATLRAQPTAADSRRRPHPWACSVAGPASSSASP